MSLKISSWCTRLICAVDQKTTSYDLVSWGKHFWTIFLLETSQNFMFYLPVCLSLWYLDLDFPLKILKIGLLFCGSPGTKTNLPKLTYQTSQPNPTKQTKPSKPSHQTKPTKPNLPNWTHQTEQKKTLPKQTYLTKPNKKTFQTKPTKPNLPNQAYQT